MVVSHWNAFARSSPLSFTPRADAALESSSDNSNFPSWVCEVSKHSQNSRDGSRGTRDLTGGRTFEDYRIRAPPVISHGSATPAPWDIETSNMLGRAGLDIIPPDAPSCTAHRFPKLLEMLLHVSQGDVISRVLGGLRVNR